MQQRHRNEHRQGPYDLEWVRDVLRLIGSEQRDEAMAIASQHGPENFEAVSESWDDVVPVQLGPCGADFGVPATHPSGNEDLVPSNKHLALAEVLRRGGYRCAYCSRGIMSPLVVVALKYGISEAYWPTGRNFADCHPIVLPNYPALEHVWPVSRGGHKRHRGNLVASCWRCNLTKGNKLLAELGWAPPTVEPPAPYDGLVEEALSAWLRIEPEVDVSADEGWPSPAVAAGIVKGHERVDSALVDAARLRLLR
jgi:hypothetical protein